MSIRRLITISVQISLYRKYRLYKGEIHNTFLKLWITVGKLGIKVRDSKRAIVLENPYFKPHFLVSHEIRVSRETYIS